MMPRTGDIVHLGFACGAPLRFRPINFRIIRVPGWPTWEGTTWLDGYELDHLGVAVERRTVYVITAGIRLVTPAPAPVTRAGCHKARNIRPARTPRPRTPEPTSGGIR